MGTISPSIDQGAKLIFRNSVHEMAQQTKSRLGSSPACVYVPAEGKTYNYSRMGRVDLVEVNSRNPDKQYTDYALDNRRMTTRRLTRTIQIDNLHDVNSAISDPTGALTRMLAYAMNRTVDISIIASAVGDVLCGAPDAAATTVSAATDGVITVDASAGLTSAKIDEVTQNFINGDLDYSDIQGSMIALTGKENTALMGQTNFVSNDFTNNRPVDMGVMNKASLYQLVYFAGSVTGGSTVAAPVLPEDSGTGTRSCVILAPKSIVISTDLALLDVAPSASKVNSVDVTIDFWIRSMRTEGSRVQILKTTM